MHILQIYKDYAPVLGGIENHLRDLSEGLVQRGHIVTVLVTSRSRQTVIERPIPGLTILKAARLLHLASTPLSVEQLLLAHRLRPDVAHLHFPYPPGDLAYRALPQPTPLVITYHSDIVRQQTMLRLYRPLLQRTLRRATRIIATSPNYLASSPFLLPHAAKTVIAPLGIDLARFAQADPAAVAAIRSRYDDGDNKRVVLLFVGRLRYYKGLHILLNAMPQVQAELLIAGTGPMQAPLQQQAQQLGIAERVHFLGDVPDAELPTLYHAADLFVLPAHLRAEALGLAQIEALASGVPCVSTELGTGTSYANRDGETGLVVPPNDPDALAAALQTLIANPSLRRQYGAAGQQRAQRLFSQAHMLDQVEETYRAALTARYS